MRKFKVLAIFVVLLAVILSVYFAFGTYSQGTRVGTVVKLSNKGWINKSWEGTLVLGSQGANNTWDFSVTTQPIADQVQAAMDNQTKVRLHYEEGRWTFGETDTNYIIVGVEPVPK